MSQGMQTEYITLRPTGLRAVNGDATEVERSDTVIHPDALLNPLWKVNADSFTATNGLKSPYGNWSCTSFGRLL